MKQNNEVQMKVVKVRQVAGKNGLIGIAQVQLGDDFVVDGILVFRARDGESVRLAMPQRSYETRQKEKVYEDIFHPISAEARKRITDIIAQEPAFAKENTGVPDAANACR